MHVCEPIAGLRSSGKGANRTILDCCSAIWGGEWQFSAAAGAAGAITGSAITNIIDKYIDGNRVTDMDALKTELTEYVRAMKGATITP